MLLRMCYFMLSFDMERGNITPVSTGCHQQLSGNYHRKDQSTVVEDGHIKIFFLSLSDSDHMHEASKCLATFL